MKPFRWVRELAASFRLPEPETPEQIQARVDAALEAERAAKRARTAEERIAYAKRLAPFAGRLFITTDFGPFEGDWTQHTTRTVDALGSAGLTPSVVVGTSVHLNPTRGPEGQAWQYGTQASITKELQRRGYEAVLPPATERHDHIDPLLRMLVLAAEGTARIAQSRDESSDFGHVAVVPAFEMSEIGIPGIPENGSLFVLQGTDVESGQLSWQMIATEPPQHP